MYFRVRKVGAPSDPTIQKTEEQLQQILEKDVNAITDIYNEAVRNTVATFDTVEATFEQRMKWVQSHGFRHPVLIAEVEATCEIVGWASLGPWSERLAYYNTAEVSVYVSPHAQGKGVGRKLLSTLLELARIAKLHTIIARIADGNDHSIKLHHSCGFQHIGVMKEVGYKFERFIDVVMMQWMAQDNMSSMS
eukprot:TRINITY_DN10342_c0_g1_i1.p1 TRINITY_DN10342_c0_g1~~TRINITY_DN10342_c0_g1_i1.p1  ORF type:complete len:208 (-),score=8.85 TRINITY_DN10342_c0_g1_i1:35-610(-)